MIASGANVLIIHISIRCCWMLLLKDKAVNDSLPARSVQHAELCVLAPAQLFSPHLRCKPWPGVSWRSLGGRLPRAVTLAISVSIVTRHPARFYKICKCRRSRGTEKVIEAKNDVEITADSN